MNFKHEYKSEAVNDLIRKAHGIEATRVRLIEAELSEFTEMSREEIRAEIRRELRHGGEIQN